jgi:hypothetical protein
MEDFEHRASYSHESENEEVNPAELFGETLFEKDNENRKECRNIDDQLDNCN